MNLIQTLALPLLGLATAVGSFFGASQVHAQTNQQSLVEQIAQRFQLNQSDVQSVFDQNRSQHQQMMQDRLKTRLDQLVKDGKLTADKEQLILNKLKELANQRQADWNDLKNLTAEQRKQKLSDQKKALEDWASQNGIDLQTIMPFGKGFGHMGRSMMNP